MENQVQLFNHPEFGEVRVVDNNGEVWLVGKDVATALGYSNPAKALADHVPAKYKLNNESLSSLGQRGGWLINEAGVYKLVMRSKLPSAEKFSDWVCEEVLPSIRKTGMYINPNAPIDPAFLRKIADDLEARDKKIAELNTQVVELKPKADYCQEVLQTTDTVPITVIAKEYGYSGVMFNQLLFSFKIQYPVGNNKKLWTLYQDYVGKGYTLTDTVITRNGGSAMQMKWTQRGRNFLYNELKKRGIVPLRERQEPLLDLFGGVTA